MAGPDIHDLDLNSLTMEMVDGMTDEQLNALLIVARAQAAAWKPTEKQRLAEEVSEQAFETLYGGAAGGGKSEWVLMHAWNLSIKYPGHKSLLLRRTYPELEESLILVSLDKYDSQEATYKVADKKWVFKNGSSIKFGHMEQEKDRFQFKSAAYELVAFDELTSFTEVQYDYLVSRCRTTKAKAAKGIRPHMISATNPGDIGGPWVKERFIDAAPWGTVFEGEEGLTRAFVQARLPDNPHIDDGYLRRLSSMKNKVEVRQLRDGDWEAFENRFFPRWNREVHVIEPFDIPEWWPRARGLDWGYRDPFAVVWGAYGPDSALYIYREAYEREMTASEQAALVLELSADEKILATYADPSIFSTDSGGESTNIRYARKGLHCVKAFNPRIAGWTAMHDALRVTFDSEGVAHTGLYVFSTCVNWLRTVPMLPRDDHKPEDAVTRNVEDHLADATRYLVATHGRKGRAPEAEGSEVDRLHARADRHRRHGRTNHSVLGRF